MKLKKTWTRLLSLVMAIAVLSSVSMSAVAAPDMDDAKASLADVKITQVYNDKTTESAAHDYRTDGSKVDVSYSAKLNMTEEMAIYLQARQENLMKAGFNVHAHMDMNLLECKSSTVTLTFASTFLKPADSVNAKLISVKDGVFTYEMTMAKSAVKSDMVIPMELIVYYDGETAYGYEDAKAFPDADLLYADFTTKDWMHDITLKSIDLKVKAGVEKEVTTDATTWKTVKAYGTVDGNFSYITDPAEDISDLIEHEKLGYVTTMEFGNGKDVTEWKSNLVKVQLMRTNQGGGGNRPEDLNTVDHYSYIIGYKDGLLRPYGTITRGEVATIFFRLLTDEAREKYWKQTNKYNDVPMELWCNNAISTLSNMGIIDGFNDGSFRPYGKITRAQFAKMAVGFFETTAEEYKGYFTDVPADAWYASYVEAASRVGLINGFEDGTFRPNTNITRAQACVIVNRALGRHPHEEHLLPNREMLVWPDNKPSDWFYADMQEATNSHDYKWIKSDIVGEDGKKVPVEEWTDKLSQRDWAALEHAWSDAHSAQGGGDVIKG